MGTLIRISKSTSQCWQEHQCSPELAMNFQNKQCLLIFIVFTNFVFLVRSKLSPIHVENGNFVDTDGRIRLFRGINSVIKDFPWYDHAILDPVRHQQMEDWGFNAVRLGSMWSGVEPEEGMVNETYIGVLKEIVSGLADHGIYTYLDMHQDVLKEVSLGGFTGYAGVPNWLSAKFRPPAHPYPWPMYNTSGYSTWACGYFAEEISNGFQQLYQDHKTEFANFWRQVALRFRGDPAILGYELMNEPWTGDMYRDGSLLLPGNAGYELLEPFYNVASDAIREVDDETIIFWEPVTYAYFVNVHENMIIDGVLDEYLKSHNITDFLPILKEFCGDMDENTGEIDFEKDIMSSIKNSGEASSQSIDKKTSRPSTLGPGFTAPPGGYEYLNRTAMSWHFYCWALGYSNDEEFDPVLKVVCDDLLALLVFETVDARAEELGGSATMLTEWGQCWPSYDHPEYQGSIVCKDVLDLADLHFSSWSYWDTASGFILWDKETGELNIDTVKVFTRPYPQATAGTPAGLKFEFDTRIFQYKFIPNTAIPSPTEIFVPPLIYPEGFDVIVSSALEWEQDGNKILLRANDDTLAFIHIMPK